MIRSIVPQFFTADLGRTLAYYRDALGFATSFTWGEPPSYAGVARDGQALYFRCLDRLSPPLPEKESAELLDAYINVADIAALHAEYRARGVAFARDLGATPWGMTEFVVRDCDGRLLAFGMDTPAGGAAG